MSLLYVILVEINQVASPELSITRSEYTAKTHICLTCIQYHISNTSDTESISYSDHFIFYKNMVIIIGCFDLTTIKIRQQSHGSLHR